SSAHALAAWSYIFRNNQMWTTDPENERAAALSHARSAVDYGTHDSTALWMAGHVIAYTDDNEEGARVVDRSLILNPNDAEAWNIAGWIKYYIGDGQGAIDCFKRAIRLSPLGTLTYIIKSGFAYGHFTEGQYEETVKWADQSLTEQPRFFRVLLVKAAA